MALAGVVAVAASPGGFTVTADEPGSAGGSPSSDGFSSEVSYDCSLDAMLDMPLNADRTLRWPEEECGPVYLGWSPAEWQHAEAIFTFPISGTNICYQYSAGGSEQLLGILAQNRTPATGNFASDLAIRAAILWMAANNCPQGDPYVSGYVPGRPPAGAAASEGTAGAPFDSASADSAALDVCRRSEFPAEGGDFLHRGAGTAGGSDPQSVMVRSAQSALLALGHGDATMTADGSLGPITQAAVRAFQEENGLYADGLIGPRTWSTLFEQSQAAGVC
jgi:hypothetical protein